MSRLHLPDNIKVHFASMESKNHIQIIGEMGVQYALYSAFPFVCKKLFGKKGGTTDNDRTIPIWLEGNMRHVIQDSGLFSLLYGSKSHLATQDIVFRWYDALVEWTLEHGQDVTVVEVDCQDILGQEVAWDLRQRIRKDLPNNRIINVFHLSDGVKGLDRLIEFSDYIGIGSGTPQNSGQTMYEVSSYIKEKKPEMDIHLLGCTIPKMIRKCNFCTSCDSVSWVSPLRFGWIGDYHIADLDPRKIEDLVGPQVYSNISKLVVERNAPAYCASIEINKRIYEKYCGNQDYSRRFYNKSNN